MGAGEIMDKIQFDYFQGKEAEQYSFYRVPKVLFTEGYFKTLSCEAKVLYGLMLDRMGLSLKNRWLDEKDRVYIIFTIEEIMELMCCKTQKAVKLMKELDTESGIGLIEKRRLGFGKPNVIYVKNFKIKGNTSQKEIDERAGSKDEDTEELEDGQEEIHAQTAKEETGQGAEENSGGEQELEEQNNVQNQNSRILKIKNQEKTKMSISGNMKAEMQKAGKILTEIPPKFPQNFENQNSRVLKIEIQEFPKSKFKNSENQNSGILKIKNQEFRFSKANNTDNNKTDLIYPYPIYSQSICLPESTSEIEKMEGYRNTIRKNISYESFLDNPYYEQKEVDELVELMSDVMMLPNNAVLRIAGVKRPVSVVKNRFMKFHYPHMEYVMYCLKRSSSKVENIRAYLLTTLYNATMTIENFYRSEVHHDQYKNG